MKLNEYFSITDGTAKFSISESIEPMCKRDFWQAYRMKPEWNAEIANVKLIPRNKESNRLWYDDVIVLITLK